MKCTAVHPGSSLLPALNIQGGNAGACAAVESLESRLLLSGNVHAAVSNGNLIIQGDAGANAIVMDQVGLNTRQVRISGADGTTINNQAGPIVLGGIRGDVAIQMAAGLDSVTMNNLITPGNVSVRGQQNLSLNNVQVALGLKILRSPNTTIANTSIGQSLIIKDQLFQSGAAQGNVHVVLQSVRVEGNTKLVGGMWTDTFTIEDSTFNGGMWLQTGRGRDVVQIEGHGDPAGRPTRFRGPVVMVLETGDDTLQVGIAGQSGNRAVFSNAVYFDGGPGFDSLANPGVNNYVIPSQVGIVNFESNLLAQAPINLGAAGAFAVMATASINSTGPTQIYGDVGLNPGSAQGIPPAQVSGTIHVNDPATVAARASLLAAYNDAVSRSVNAISLPGNLGGLTLTPGLYTNSTSVLIQGAGPGNNVTLDAQGDPNAIFIFKVGSTLTTGPGAQVILAGGAKASNIFWQVGTSATLGTTTIFKGNILAAVTITVNTGSVVRGRLLAGANSDGSVTVNASTVRVPAA